MAKQKIKTNASLVEWLLEHGGSAIRCRTAAELMKVNDLDKYRTSQGTYIFPRSYLQERPSGYWVMGAYMGLEENRRKKITIELESTFWLLKIKKTAGLL